MDIPDTPVYQVIQEEDYQDIQANLDTVVLVANRVIQDILVVVYPAIVDILAIQVSPVSQEYPATVVIVDTVDSQVIVGNRVIQDTVDSQDILDSVVLAYLVTLDILETLHQDTLVYLVTLAHQDIVAIVDYLVDQVIVEAERVAIPGSVV